MIMLFQDFGGAPVLFIRYNPDAYKAADGKRVTGGNAACEAKLLEVLRNLRNHTEWAIPMSIIYMFYDGYTAADLVPSVVDIFAHTVIKASDKFAGALPAVQTAAQPPAAGKEEEVDTGAPPSHTNAGDITADDITADELARRVNLNNR